MLLSGFNFTIKILARTMIVWVADSDQRGTRFESHSLHFTNTIQDVSNIRNKPFSITLFVMSNHFSKFQMSSVYDSRLIKLHHDEHCCFLLATSDLAFEVDERKRFSRVVCNFIVIVELDENIEVEFFVRFKLDETGKDGAMFTVCYLDHVRRPDEIVNRLSIFFWIVHNFVLLTFSITNLYVTKSHKMVKRS